jgi:signal transduction histidine kinase
VLLGYFIVSLILVILLSVVLARPLQKLRRDSREIASGNYSKHLTVSSKIHEIHELSHDLETMRSNLVGVNAQLQKEIIEREAAETMKRDLETRLRHSQRLESIGTLAGGIAHEINNILLPLHLYTDLALEDLPDMSPVRTNLERVLKLANRAKGLSQQILTFSRRTGDTEQVAQDIAPIVEEALTMVRALVPATIDIRVDIRHNQGRVLCGATQIQQLVVNLCSNAFRSVSRSGGHIQINLISCDVDEEFAGKHPNLHVGKYLRFEVIDTGEGIDSATLERIFEPFFTTQEVGKGTGLGLSVVHGIVVDHGGEIIVSSEPGKGSAFAVYLPQAQTEEIDLDKKQL